MDSEVVWPIVAIFVLASVFAVIDYGLKRAWRPKGGADHSSKPKTPPSGPAPPTQSPRTMVRREAGQVYWSSESGKEWAASRRESLERK